MRSRRPGASPGPARAIRALPLDNRTPRRRFFTDVRTRVMVIGMARSYPKSEYAQPLVDPKQTLFDTNIESWQYSGAYPRGGPVSRDCTRPLVRMFGRETQRKRAKS